MVECTMNVLGPFFRVNPRPPFTCPRLKICIYSDMPEIENLHPGHARD